MGRSAREGRMVCVGVCRFGCRFESKMGGELYIQSSIM